MKSLIYTFLAAVAFYCLVVISVLCYYAFSQIIKEPFGSEAPVNEDSLLLSDTYPVRLHDNSGFVNTTKMSSFAQITNNFKYPQNPDNGTNQSKLLFYDNKANKSNVVKQNPVVKKDGVRVGFFSS
jgi:hypothetical protein